MDRGWIKIKSAQPLDSQSYLFFVIIKLINVDLTGSKGKAKCKGGVARGRGRGGRAYEAEEVLEEIAEEPEEEPEVPEYDPTNATQADVDAAYAEFVAMYADADE